MAVILSLGAHVVVNETIETTRLFRVEQTYAVMTGKWYFEFEAITGGDMRVGWARPGCRPDVELGTDNQAFVFDGYKVSELLLCSLQELLVSLTVCNFPFLRADACTKEAATSDTLGKRGTWSVA